MSILLTINQILTAGIAITAFSLLLYAISFNLKHDVVRAFTIILVSVVIVFTSEAIGSVAVQPTLIEFWLRLQWVGIIFLPPAYFQLSDALLASTGKPSRGRRYWMVRFVYLLAFTFLLTLILGWLVGPIQTGQPPAPRLQSTLLTGVFIAYNISVLMMAGYNYIRAYQRTATSTSRRRMGYLLVGGIGPVLGSFPFLIFSSNFAANNPRVFLSIAILANLVVGFLLVVMAYAVAFFDAFWSDRVVKKRLFKWILRGPATASLTLALVTIVRRAGENYGATYTAMVPIVMVGTVLLCEYLITIFAPFGERWLFAEGDENDVHMLRLLEDRLLTRNDLRQFLEMVLAVVCDRLQAAGAYLVAWDENRMELVVRIGETRFEREAVTEELTRLIAGSQRDGGMFQWGEDLLVPLMSSEDGEAPELLGILGIAGASQLDLEGEQASDVDVLAERAALALRDRRLQERVFRSIEELAPQVEYIQRLRAASRYDREDMLLMAPSINEDDVAQWVKEALTHYWGGPRLTENPLLKFQMVQDALQEHDGNPSNALRAILREAIDRVRPEGERRFTGEWILYNILEMKFLEGKKVREIAMRLAMSEADLYRKQRVAIEAVAKAVVDMEQQAKQQIIDEE